MKKKSFYFICFVILLSLFLENCNISEILMEKRITREPPPLSAPLLAEVLMHLQLDYVDPEKLGPEFLLEGVLRELGLTIPEITVVHELQKKPLGSILRVSFKNERTQVSVSEMYGLYDLNIALQILLKKLLQMNPQLTQIKIEQIFVRGILNQLDAYSVLLPQEIYNEFNIKIDGQFAGVGLVVGTRDGQLTVIAPMDESPAALAGM